jgi:mRNA interferase MazF
MERRILRGGIYWASLNPTIGREQAGTRPVLVASINSFNTNGKCAIAFPITSKPPKVVYPLVYELPPDLLPKPSWVKISRIRTLDSERLKDFLKSVTEEDLEQILSGFDRLVGRGT